MRHKPKTTVRLDDLAAGRLAKRALAAMQGIDLTIGELAAWQASKPKLRVEFTEPHLDIEVTLRFGTRKLVALTATLVGVGVAAAMVLADSAALVGALARRLASN